MEKNDFPNISIIANSTGFDIFVNAELQPSQKVMLEQIRRLPEEFDRLLAGNSNIWLKTYLKFEHQPGFYNWILSNMKSPGAFNGETIRQIKFQHNTAFAKERRTWIDKITAENKELSERQIHHLNARNKQLNIAIRLVGLRPRNGS
jgi:signal transduction protein with GAF and PtsI domain